jgi:hypothetical protein
MKEVLSMALQHIALGAAQQCEVKANLEAPFPESNIPTVFGRRHT